MSRGGRNSAQQIERESRRAKALELRLGGCTYREIGTVLATSESFACRLVRDEMRRQRTRWAETAAQVRDLELSRLDRLLRGVYPDAIRGSLGHVDRALKIMERRARLLGLDLQLGDLDPGDEIVILRSPLRSPALTPAVVAVPPPATSGRLNGYHDQENQT